jgi:SAM-dependent methyltransferase
MPDQALGYCKLCELADFRHPELRPLIRDVNGVGEDRPDFPEGEEHRKSWEIAMTARALRDHGALRDDAEILGVGAGQESTIFWLTRHVRRVFATDLYLEEDSWSETDSGPGMLVSPAWGAEQGWNPRRLVAQHMDGTRLNYEDDSFDGIFSSGSIEHFGSLKDIRRSVEEMFRVLKPGGVAAIATEYRIEGPPGLPGTVLFDEDQLRSVVLDGMKWELASPLDLSIDEETLLTVVEWRSLMKSGEYPTLPKRLLSALRGQGWDPPEPDVEFVPPPLPHLVIRFDDYIWTSVHLTLIKPS